MPSEFQHFKPDFYKRLTCQNVVTLYHMWNTSFQKWNSTSSAFNVSPWSWCQRCHSARSTKATAIVAHKLTQPHILQYSHIAWFIQVHISSSKRFQVRRKIFLNTSRLLSQCLDPKLRRYLQNTASTSEQLTRSITT